MERDAGHAGRGHRRLAALGRLLLLNAHRRVTLGLHVADDASRVAHHDGVAGHRPGDHRAGADHGPLADCEPREHGRVRPDRRSPAHVDRLGLLACPAAPGEPAGHKGSAGGHKHIVCDLHAVPYLCGAGDVTRSPTVAPASTKTCVPIAQSDPILALLRTTLKGPIVVPLPTSGLSQRA